MRVLKVENTKHNVIFLTRWNYEAPQLTTPWSKAFNTHTHTHTRLDLTWVLGSNYVFFRTTIVVPKWNVPPLPWVGPLPTWIQNLVSSCTFKILHFIYQIYRNPKVSFHIDKMNIILFYFILFFRKKIFFFLNFELIYVYMYIYISHLLL
jgi:hypothetical protein